jgi:hypothetical protein
MDQEWDGNRCEDPLCPYQPSTHYHPGGMTVKERNSNKKTVDLHVQVAYCPFSTCSGHVDLELTWEDGGIVKWEGECSLCKKTFMFAHEKVEQ